MIDPPAMDRTLSTVLFLVALGSLGGAGVILVNGFLEYLQTGGWSAASLLQIGYDTHVIRARWFLANDWSWWLHDLLEMIPSYVALLAVAPCAWWLSTRFGER
jgi:hypothetical protein